MHGQFVHAALFERVYAGVIPDIGSRSAMLTQLEIIHMRAAARLPDEDELVLGPVEGAHPGIALVPDAEIFELPVDRSARDQHLVGVAPVHADVMNRAVFRMCAQESSGILQEGNVFRLAHLAGGHGEIAMPDAPQSADVSRNGDVIWWIGEYEFRLGASQQRLIGMVIPRIAAVQAVRAQYPCIPWLYDRL